jgi:hypothetical protein
MIIGAVVQHVSINGEAFDVGSQVQPINAQVGKLCQLFRFFLQPLQEAVGVDRLVLSDMQSDINQVLFCFRRDDQGWHQRFPS